MRIRPAFRDLPGGQSYAMSMQNAAGSRGCAAATMPQHHAATALSK